MSSPEIEIESLFSLAREARCLADAEQGLDGCGDTDDVQCLFVADSAHKNNAAHRPEATPGRATFHALPDGDIHVCYGAACPHVTISAENSLVCRLSGEVVGIHTAFESDATWTGRSRVCANPEDIHATSDAQTNGWVRKRDAYSASVNAYRMAATLSDADTSYPHPHHRHHHQEPHHQQQQGALRNASSNSEQVRVSKRNALCVDQVSSAPEGAREGAPSVVHRKRRRASRRSAFSCDDISKMRSEVDAILDKLMHSASRPEATPSRPHRPTEPPSRAAAHRAAPPPPPDAAGASASSRPLDPRLQNEEFVRRLALRRYVRACAEGDERASLDGVQNVLIAVNKFVRAQRELADERLERATREARSADQVDPAPPQPATARGARGARGAPIERRLRAEIGALIVTLWRAVCATNYLKKDRNKANESFRPFIAGVLYSFKRGVFLGSGECIIPVLPFLCEYLPSIRSNTVHSLSSKQIQSSSHRGVCCLQRALASLSEMTPAEREEAQRHLGDAVRQAQLLQTHVAE